MSRRELITLQQLAERLGVGRRTVDRWLANGTLERAGLVETNRIGHRRQFDAASVDQVLWRRRTGGLRMAS